MTGDEAISIFKNGYMTNHDSNIQIRNRYKISYLQNIFFGIKNRDRYVVAWTDPGMIAARRNQRQGGPEKARLPSRAVSFRTGQTIPREQVIA